MYAVIVENDVSKWDDKTGVTYHFPNKYINILTPGTKAIYYKGKLTDNRFGAARMSPDPHYFGIVTINKIYPDPKSRKNKFATLVDFTSFEKPVSIKQMGQYLESIPSSKASNYWRDGVRQISEETYKKILSFCKLGNLDLAPDDANDAAQGFESYKEGSKKEKYTTFYERDSRLRKQAIMIHGVTCVACSSNFETKYGEHGKGFIHVHHVKPISEFGGPQDVDPATDLTVLCPNCHSMVHRYRDKTLTIEELKKMLTK